MEKVWITKGDLSFEHVRRVVFEGAPVSLSPEVLEQLRQSRAVVEKALHEGRIIYGINTGFGKLSDVRIPPDKIELLQRNLILSHSAGVGPPLSKEVVRATLLLKIQALSRGHSGCRPVLVERLVQMLNAGVHPVMPSKGSVGASGDLAPLAHLSLVLLGLGQAEFQGQILPGEEALRRAGIAPLQFQAKEGLALVNGTQVMTAQAVLNVLRAENVIKVADIAGALSVESLLGTDATFDERIHRVRNQKGQVESARNLRCLLADSAIVRSHKHCPRIQDAYSLRCIPQVHGASRDTFWFVREVVHREMNASTDNPLIFPEEGEILLGGNFHGQPLALSMDYLTIAIAELANISERRIAYHMDPQMSSLPSFLAREPGLNSGFMIAQVTAASLVSENKVLAHPASVDSIPTSANKEDHVSMGTFAAGKAAQVLENTEYVLAIECLCAAQGIDFRKPYQPGKGTAIAYRLIRKAAPFLEKDRILTPDIEKIKALIATGEMIREVEKEVKLL